MVKRKGKPRKIYKKGGIGQTRTKKERKEERKVTGNEKNDERRRK